MTKLILVPIEPLEERYTASWYRNLPTLFKSAGFAVEQIEGVPLEADTIKVGTFLDINSTIHYKMSQLQQIARKFHRGQIEPGTVFFFSDIEFWGLESVRLMADMNKVPIKMCGFLHAASYTREDAFAIAEPYQRFTEVGWLSCLDKVFVGSHYHKQALYERRIVPHAHTQGLGLQQKVIVTRNPLFMSDYELITRGPKQKKMLLTNRLDEEKRPHETLALFKKLKQRFPDWEFVVTTSRPQLRSNNPVITQIARDLEAQGVVVIKDGLTKRQYHQELASAAIMVTHSIEENYGYCIAEALIYGVLPLMRKGVSHDEWAQGDDRLLFLDTVDDLYKATELIKSFGTNSFPPVPTLDRNGATRIAYEVIALSEGIK